MSALLGPILQFRGINNNHYAISALVVYPINNPLPQVVVQGNATVQGSQKLADIPFSAPKFSVYRVDLLVTATDGGQLSVIIGSDSASFFVPALNSAPNMAYASCNGFSDPKLKKQVDFPNDRWRDLIEKHRKNPFHLLLLGGDQVYSDDMWHRLDTLNKWADGDADAKQKADFTPMADSVDDYYCNLYLTRWKQPEVHLALKSIPTVMMWDDHDIFDGWGSYPDELHNSKVYQGIFKIAKKYFEIFQMQQAPGQPHPASLPKQKAFNCGFKKLGNIGLLSLDLRSERTPTPNQILSTTSWDAVYAWLDSYKPGEINHLLILSSIPVAYLDLNLLEKTLNALPGQQELEDDLRDHWRSRSHQGERVRLIHRLFEFSKQKNCRVSLLSGDVHLAALAVIESERHGEGHAAVINQFISSAIVHTPPIALARYMLEKVADKEESVDRGITSSMVAIGDRGSYLVGGRNWLSIQPDTQKRLWVKWFIEHQAEPITKVVHSI